MNNNNLITLDGWISDFWEQGMERMPYWIFQDRKFCKNRDEGWTHNGIHILKHGDKLTIFDDNKDVLWNDVIKVRRTGFFGLKTLYPNEYNWSPEDVEHTLWRNWFVRKPPLKAKLTFSDDK